MLKTSRESFERRCGMMAKTNMFTTGDYVTYKNKTGKILRNDKDFRCWRVEFDDCIRILHFEDLELTFITKEREQR